MVADQSNNSAYDSCDPGLFFQDGKRKIDYVLVHRQSDPNEEKELRRVAFLSALAGQMIEIEIEDCNGNILGGTDSKEEIETSIQMSRIFPAKSANITDFDSSQPAEPQNVFDDSPAEHKTDKPSDTSPPTSMDRYRLAAQEDYAYLAQSEDLVFVKLHVSWTTMSRYAEYLNMRKPLRPLTYGWQVEKHMEKVERESTCCNCFGFGEDVIKPMRFAYTWPFSVNRQYLFDIPPNKDDFFTAVERALVLDFILRRTGSNFSGNEMEMTNEPGSSNMMQQRQFMDTSVPLFKNFGITKLLKDGVFLAAYPLHEPGQKLKALFDRCGTESHEQDALIINRDDFKMQPTKKLETSDPLNNRILLERYWASFKQCFRFQPVHYIRYYFGETVGFYFAWLGFYTAWLSPIAVFGILVFLFGLLDMRSDTIIREVCVLGTNITMCPMCPEVKCRFWTLDTACLRTKLMRLVDHTGTVIFAVVMALWAVIFLEMWKREQISLAYYWSVHTLEPIDQPPRPEFMALLEKGYPPKRNPVSGFIEPFVPFWRRKVPMLFVSYSTILLGIALTLAFLVGVIFYKLVVKALMYQNQNPIVNTMAGITTTVSGSVLSLIGIYILKLVYDRLAIKMTDLEDHRTQLDYDNSLTLKLYLLQFVNYYSSVFYIAFIQGTTSPVPGTRRLLIQSAGCDQGDCLFELFLQLVIIMVGKQLLNFIQESSMPVIMKVFASLKSKFRKQKSPKAVSTTGPNDLEQHRQVKYYHRSTLLCRSDYLLLDPGSRPMFNEYLEMMIQYGFITMFVPAFPLAPFFGLLNNLFEIRGDAKKFVNQYRRPVLERSKTIGIWFSILSVTSCIAIRTNACIIAFTTQFIDRWVYEYSYSPDGTMDGFVNFTLSWTLTSSFQAPTNASICGYYNYRLPPWAETPFAFTTVHYHVLAAKFIFIFIFEVMAVVLTSVLEALVPDIPKHIKTQMSHEARLTNAVILRAEDGAGRLCGNLNLEELDLGLLEELIKDAHKQRNSNEPGKIDNDMDECKNIGFFTFRDDHPGTSIQRRPPDLPTITESNEDAPLIGFRHLTTSYPV